MKEADVLVIGQGLAGTWLSYWLERSGLSFEVMDDADPAAASRHAAGLINPVTGRRLVKTWLIDELLPFVWKAHQELGQLLQTELITETALIDFFPSVQMLQAFDSRYQEDATYLVRGENTDQYREWFNYALGWGGIGPCYLVHTQQLLLAWRSHLLRAGCLREERFDPARLEIRERGYQYGDLRVGQLIFCDGRSAAANGFFDKLPFALNKGEGMLVEINGLPANTVFKKGMSLVPWKDNVFWVGSSYQWEFEDDQPSEKFRLATEDWLTHFLRVPFKILDHFAAVRPATIERRPFAGFHPLHPRMGILNGLGTKGCSLAPYFAAQLASQIAGRGMLDPQADIKRFQRILMK